MKKKTAGKDAKAGKLLAVRTLEHAQLANQIKDLGLRTAQMLEKIIKSRYLHVI